MAAGYDELKGTLTVTNLAPEETAIVRITVRLACEVGATPTGNILNASKPPVLTAIVSPSDNRRSR